MPDSSEATIKLTETSYDYGVSEEVWFREVLETSLPLFDGGLGVGGVMATKSSTPHPQGEQEEVHRYDIVAGRPEFLIQHGEACRTFDSEFVHRDIKTGFWQISRSLAQLPEDLERWRRMVGCQDAVGLFALDTDGRGVHLIAPQREVVPVGRAVRGRFQMLAAHLSAGLRLRKAMTPSRSEAGDDRHSLPLDAEAVIDPSDFDVVEATENVRDARSLKSLRQAAVDVDRARSGLRRQDADEALAIWRALVRGRWSMIDWFDNDDRRYVLALPNPPHVADPRGLTDRESQVVAYAALGESHKLIAYRLGLSRPTVSNAIRAAMQKLGVRTQAQLVERFRGAPAPKAPG